MNATPLRLSLVGFGLLGALAACTSAMTGGPGPLAGNLAQQSRAQARPQATSTPDPRDLARYSSQLALTVLAFEGIDFGFVANLISPPTGCADDQEFSVSGNIVTASNYGPGSNCTGAAEETGSYTIAASSPFTSSFAATAIAGGNTYNAGGNLNLSANSLPFTYTYEIGQPSWHSQNPKNTQRGLTLNLTGSGSIGGKLSPTGGSGGYAKSFSGTKAIAATGTAKPSKKAVTVTVKGTLYESPSDSITIAPSGSIWVVSGGTEVKGASIKATLKGTNGQGGGGSFTYAYANPKDPLDPGLIGKVTAKVKTLSNNGVLTVPLEQNGKVIATLSLDTFGYGTITYFDNSVEDITDWTIHDPAS